MNNQQTAVNVAPATKEEEMIMTTQTTSNTFIPYNNCVFTFGNHIPMPPYIDSDIQQHILSRLDVFVLPEKAGFFRRVCYYGFVCGYAVNITQTFREDGDVCEWDIQYLNLEDVFSQMENMHYYRSHFGSDCALLGFAILAHWLHTDSDQFSDYLEDIRYYLPEEDDCSDLPF